MKLEPYCRKPDRHGVYNRRCKHIIEKPRGEDGLRQCRAAARFGRVTCLQHQQWEQYCLEKAAFGFGPP